MKAFSIPVEYVSGVVKAVRGYSPLDIGPIVIAEHDGGTLHLEHALVGVLIVAIHETELHFRMRKADGHLRHRQPFGMRSEHDRSRLGRAIGIGDGSPWQCSL